MTKFISSTFTTTVNLHYLQKFFKENAEPSKDSPYYQYVSKNFYGAVIRSQKTLENLDLTQIVVNIRLKGRGNSQQTVTGVKIDFMQMDDPRLQEYGINPSELQAAEMRVIANIPGNTVLNPVHTLTTMFFYTRKDGTSIINFVPADNTD